MSESALNRAWVAILIAGLMLFGLLIGLIAAFPPTTTLTFTVPNGPTTVTRHGG